MGWYACFTIRSSRAELAMINLLLKGCGQHTAARWTMNSRLYSIKTKVLNKEVGLNNDYNNIPVAQQFQLVLSNPHYINNSHELRKR